MSLKDRTFILDWLNNKVTKSGTLNIDGRILQYSPESLYLGYGTYLFAIKNRHLNFLVIPDFQVIKSPPTFEELSLNLNGAWKTRTTQTYSRSPSGELLSEHLKVPDSVAWPIAPVDILAPSLQSCDLATLQKASGPVLKRWVDALLRQYSRMGQYHRDGHATELYLKGMDLKWETVKKHLVSLGLKIDPSKETKRKVSIAKAQLTS